MSDLKGSGPQTADAPTLDDAFHELKSLEAGEGAAHERGQQADGPVLSADGTPLKRSLRRALRAQKWRALALIAPLLLFVLLTFIAPILDMLFRSVENDVVPDTIPRTVVALRDWDAKSGKAPGDDVFVPFYFDFAIAAHEKAHTALGARLNYQDVGMSSLFRRSGRHVDDIGKVYKKQFHKLNAAWDKPETWTALMGSPAWQKDYTAWLAKGDNAGASPAFKLSEGARETLPRTAQIYDRFAADTQKQRRKTLERTKPWAVLYTALYMDLKANSKAAQSFDGDSAALLADAAGAVPDFETVDIRDYFINKISKDWGKVEPWATIKTYSGRFTSGYYLNAVDLRLTPDGVALQPESKQIYLLLFKRTLYMSLVITGACILLGYPVSFLLANLPARKTNLLMILVLLPFWTSLLVRTSAWKVMLQQQGVINDVLVWLGMVDDAHRLVMINNQFGTIVAMTHILLPFMILPMFSVMSTIPPYYVRAARSLGATNWTSFWRVYFPQSIPGIGAGSILVFILAIGYYITPEIVGGRTGTFISNRIAYHISSSLNWGLAAALGSILLAAVMILYWAYDKIVGIDNVKLG